MSEVQTTPRRKFWGWGNEGSGLDETQQADLRQRTAERYGISAQPAATPPRVEDFDLRAPRIAPPSSLAELCTADPWERLVHSYGKSFPDSVRIFRRDVPEPPDVVAYPQSESDVVQLLDWADTIGAAVIPFGGGTSVVGGVEPAVSGSYVGTVSLDLARLDRVLEIDRSSRAARIQAGATGPGLESQLKEQGLTLRHFPQSFEMATLGGMIATRSGGHFATLYTHIDDFVESTRSVTPQGILESRRLPGSGAGPSPDRMMIGSEGILGIITEAWLRLQDRPTFRASAAVHFDDFYKASNAVRAVSQAGLFPANCRLIDAAESHGSGAGDGSNSLLVLGFESADHPVDAWMARAEEIVADHGGRVVPPATEAGHLEGAVGAWRQAFINAPYYREVLVPLGVISDTFETAITWDRFEEFHATVIDRLRNAMRSITGNEGSITCRFTHSYPDGPAPYFTFQTCGDWSRVLDQWREIKIAANEVVVSSGGTVTHHHAVGRDHRKSGYDAQRPDLFARALAAAKAELDPKGLLNPGVLIDPLGAPRSAGGAIG
ncbi:MAG: FAD-binding oxidoreductase [Acidobacteriota bacterium]